MNIQLLQGDARDVLEKLPTNSHDSWVTDPPAGIGMLEQEWDEPGVNARETFIKFIQDISSRAFRVLKPGAYGLVWSLPRTSHWTGMGLENAGFELRDIVSHVYSNGYPKNRSSLKPAHESWWLVRKPGSAQVEELQLEHTRVQGRWPPNLGFSHLETCVETGTKQVKGQKSRERPPDLKSPTGWGFKRTGGAMTYPTDEDGYETLPEFACAPGCPVASLETQVPNASRFFYVSKPDPEERHAGCHDLHWKRIPSDTGYSRVEFVEWAQLEPGARAQGNIHISVKPVSLMRQLTRLITPPSGRVLDCFLGSGTTAIACVYEGLDFTGIERESVYLEIAQARVAAAQARAHAITNLTVEASEATKPGDLDALTPRRRNSTESDGSSPQKPEQLDFLKILSRAKSRKS